MSLKELKAGVALGEDRRRQFKQDVINADSLAAEMAAFANSEGGTIFIGVADDGTLPGLDKADVVRLNQLISNAASQNVRSPLTVQSANVAVGKGRVVIVLTVSKGLDKPYFDRMVQSG
jgi:ATP-dependent DNA helicase RecG